jgi:hypothetical protein
VEGQASEARVSEERGANRLAHPSMISWRRVSRSSMRSASLGVTRPSSLPCASPPSVTATTTMPVFACNLPRCGHVIPKTNALACPPQHGHVKTISALSASQAAEPQARPVHASSSCVQIHRNHRCTCLYSPHQKSPGQPRKRRLKRLCLPPKKTIADIVLAPVEEMEKLYLPPQRHYRRNRIAPVGHNRRSFYLPLKRTQKILRRDMLTRCMSA